MPARFYAKFFDLLEIAIKDVGNGIRKVNGNGYSVYRVGATIRCDLKPEWIDGEEENVAPEGKEDQKEPDFEAPPSVLDEPLGQNWRDCGGQYEPPWVEPERRGGDV